MSKIKINGKTKAIIFLSLAVFIPTIIGLTFLGFDRLPLVAFLTTVSVFLCVMFYESFIFDLDISHLKKNNELIDHAIKTTESAIKSAEKLLNIQSKTASLWRHPSESIGDRNPIILCSEKKNKIIAWADLEDLVELCPLPKEFLNPPTDIEAENGE